MPGLYQWIMFRRRIDVRADPRDGALGGFEFGHTKVSNLHCFMISGQQKILRLNIAMNDAAFVSMRKPRADLLQIKHCASKSKRLTPRQSRQVAASQIFKNDVVKCGAVKVECGAMAETADNVYMTNAIQGNCFILKVLNQGTFQIRILIALKQNVQCLNNHFPKSLVRSSAITRYINLSVAAAAQALFNIVTAVDSAL